MKRAVKVAISLPDALLHRVDRACRERKVSRSEYFRQAATNLLGLTGDQEVDRYVRGYSKHPETPDEVEENVRIARQFKSFGAEQMRMLEKRTSAQASALTYYKMP